MSAAGASFAIGLDILSAFQKMSIDSDQAHSRP
jgi:hypothetical protein